MKRYKLIILTVTLTALMMTSCLSDLDTEPLNKRITTSNLVFKDPASYKQFLAKLYGGLTLTGQAGPVGKAEIPNGDEGETSFLRMYWGLQEITTDECNMAWGGESQDELRYGFASDKNPFNKLMYERIFINLAYCNEYIREVGSRVDGLSSPLKEEATAYIAEARFLRALYYFYAMDLWGNVPFVTENDGIGAYLPKQIDRADLFKYIESELLAVAAVLPKPGVNEYARAGQSSAWMLLAKIYLNAKVYTGTERYTDCITYCNNIINSGVYSLNPSYKNLFRADNNTLINEIIFPIAEDGISSPNYGGVTFIVHGATGVADALDAMVPSDFGIDAGWAGFRFRKDMVAKFADISGATDKRAADIYTTQRTLEINNVGEYKEGYGCVKFQNLTSTGAPGKHITFVDTDFPLFRFADVYLMYAEAVKRDGTGGDLATAVSYINKIRERAYGDQSGNIAAADLTLDFILDERARELHWEAQRRTDLIRYGYYTGSTYTWEWKGKVKAGTGVDSHYDLYPIPSTDLAINTSLKQNLGY